MKKILFYSLLITLFSCSNTKEYEQRLSKSYDRIVTIEHHANRIAGQTELFFDNFLDGREDSETSKIAKDICVLSSEEAEKVVDSLDNDIAFFKSVKHNEDSFNDFITLYTNAKSYLDAVRSTKQKSIHDYTVESRQKRESLHKEIEQFKLKYLQER